MADANQVPNTQQQAPQQSVEHRNAWVFTGYGIFGLGMLAAVAYACAQYAVR